MNALRTPDDLTEDIRVLFFSDSVLNARTNLVKVINIKFIWDCIFLFYFFFSLSHHFLQSESIHIYQFRANISLRMHFILALSKTQCIYNFFFSFQLRTHSSFFPYNNHKFIKSKLNKKKIKANELFLVGIVVKIWETLTILQYKFNI